MKLINTKQAAEMLGSTVNTLRYWRYVGKGPKTYNLLGRVRYDMDELERFVLSCLEPSPRRTGENGNLPASRQPILEL